MLRRPSNPRSRSSKAQRIAATPPPTITTWSVIGQRSAARTEHGSGLDRVAQGDPPLADHAVDDHVLEAVQRLLEPVAQAASREGRRVEALLHPLHDLDVLAVDGVPEARQPLDSLLAAPVDRKSTRLTSSHL